MRGLAQIRHRPLPIAALLEMQRQFTRNLAGALAVAGLAARADALVQDGAASADIRS